VTVPTAEVTILRYIAWLLHHRRLAPGTIKVHLAAIRHLHIINGFADPAAHSDRITLARKAAVRQVVPAPLRVPVRAEVLRQIANRLDTSYRLLSTDHTYTRFEEHLFLAAASIAFFGFLRISEFASTHDKCNSLTLSDITLIPASRYISLCLRNTKTDRVGAGVHVYIGPTGCRICPLINLDTYLRFRPLVTAATPLFIMADGSPMRAAWFRARLQQECSLVGLPGNVNTHSLRIGAASEAAAKGMPDHVIQSLGR
jgi:hypothetical protein